MIKNITAANLKDDGNGINKDNVIINAKKYLPKNSIFFGNKTKVRPIVGKVIKPIIQIILYSINPLKTRARP